MNQAAAKSIKRLNPFFIAIALLYLLAKAHPPFPLIDFDHLWWAGRLWSLGHDPYGPAFTALKPQAFPAGTGPLAWVYPPHIWALVTPLGFLDRDTASMVWLALNVALVPVNAVLVAKALSRWDMQPIWTGSILFIFVAFMTATGGALAVGQTSIVIAFGMALTIYGVSWRRRYLTAIGLAIMLLKPQIGLVGWSALAACNRERRAAILAAGIVVIGSLVPIIVGGILPTIGGFISNLMGYRSIDYNLPDAMTGIGNLAATVFAIRLSAIVLSLVGAAVAFGFMALWTMRAEEEAQDRAGRIAIMIALGTIAAFVPLHVYDLVILAPLPLLLFFENAHNNEASNYRRAFMMITGSLLIFRPENFARFMPLPPLDHASTLATIGCLVLAVMAFGITLSDKRGRNR